MLPDAFVDLATIEGLRFDVRYARSDNFTGAPLPGYERAGAWLHRSAAEPLVRVVRGLAPSDRTLVVFDAFRPVRATRAMVQWCETNEREDLLEGYVGRTSRHNRGIAIDVGLARRASGERLQMGTDWDVFHPGSWFANAKGEALDNRRALRAAMEAEGFVPYDMEWWHFERPVEPLPAALDLAYG